jgi:hypothetical protein
MKKDYLYISIIGVLGFIIYKQRQRQKNIIDQCNIALDECYLNQTTITLPEQK